MIVMVLLMLLQTAMLVLGQVALNKYPFSQIYPLTSLGFIFGMFSGMLIFHEQVGYLQWIGVILVMVGCYCIAKV